ncbi:MAG TPA: nucleotide exchange factor GrpE, partial [Verrucomicrobiae bacterium]
AKWPFLVADAALMFFAYYYVLHATLPIHHWEVAAGCIVLGAVLGVAPYYLDYRVMGKAIEVNALGAVAEKIQNLEKLADQIETTTNHLAVVQGTVQAETGKATAAAKAIADKMTEEARRFSEFMLKMNDNEKSALRLEVEKLHRAEGEWLQILVRVFDHVFALHTGAVRTGDQRFIEPISNFQHACQETVRRLGLTPFIAAPDEPFNAERHQAAGKPEKIPDGAVVAETVGAGYTFQGKLLRPALVRLREAKTPEAESALAEKVGEELPL